MIDEGANGTVWERFNLDVCTDCLWLLVNGDGSNDLAERIEYNWPGEDGWSISMGSEECEECQAGECESWFSWSSCETCGSSFGGDRHHMTAMRQLDPLEVLAREGQALNTKQLSLI